MKTITISYDDEMQKASVVENDVEPLFTTFCWDENYNIIQEQPDTDSEDFNDNARWLIKTLLCILKLEKEDEWCHCDWSADNDHFPETGKYKFNVSIKKVKEEE